MVAIARSGAPPPPTIGTPPARTTPNLDAQMRTCRAQLADWVTCPSAKTPEGKAKIEQIASKLESIKDQIKKSDVASSSEMTMQQPETPGKSERRSDGSVDFLATSGQLGRNVDTYA